MTIWACRLLDRLKADALAGDRAALERLMRLLPRDLPASERAADRAYRIRRLADDLRRALPAATDRRIAEILATAGEQIESGQHDLIGRAFAEIGTDERAWLALEIREILTWAPRRANGTAWLRLRQIQNLIA